MSSSSMQGPGERIILRECVSCNQHIVAERIFVADCNHSYCGSCVTTLFENSTEDESMFPPHCCNVITLDHARSFLSPQLVELFERKTVEYSTEDRTYCCAVNCGEFIPYGSIGHDNKAVCPKCQGTTCALCESEAHDGECPSDTALGQLKAVATENGWRGCFRCNSIIELQSGCNHITFVVPFLAQLPGKR